MFVFSITLQTPEGAVLIDYSKNRITAAVREHLLQLVCATWLVKFNHLLLFYEWPKANLLAMMLKMFM